MMAYAKTEVFILLIRARTGNCISSSMIYGLHLVNRYYGLTQNLTACLNSCKIEPNRPNTLGNGDKPDHSEPGSPSSKRKPDLTTVSTGQAENPANRGRSRSTVALLLEVEGSEAPPRQGHRASEDLLGRPQRLRVLRSLHRV